MSISRTTSYARIFLQAAAAVVFLAGAASPSWAWGRGGGFHGGYRGGVVIGPGPLWWPYYDPYYYPPYAYPYPYDVTQSYPAPASPSSQTQEAAEPAHYDLQSIEEQVAKARGVLNYQYSDGDITKRQLEKGGINIDEVENMARDEAAANGGWLTRAQEDALLRSLLTGQAPVAVAPPASLPPAAIPPTPPARTPDVSAAAPGGNLKAVVDLLPGLRRLLNDKLSRGDVTKAQHDGELNYLARLEADARAQAADAGDLTPVQENALLVQLLRAQSSIQNDFIEN